MPAAIPDCWRGFGNPHPPYAGCHQKYSPAPAASDHPLHRTDIQMRCETLVVIHSNNRRLHPIPPQPDVETYQSRLLQDQHLWYGQIFDRKRVWAAVLRDVQASDIHPIRPILGGALSVIVFVCGSFKDLLSGD